MGEEEPIVPTDTEEAPAVESKFGSDALIAFFESIEKRRKAYPHTDDIDRFPHA